MAATAKACHGSTRTSSITASLRIRINMELIITIAGPASRCVRHVLMLILDVAA
jgi:hypothetical protein